MFFAWVCILYFNYENNSFVAADSGRKARTPLRWSLTNSRLKGDYPMTPRFSKFCAAGILFFGMTLAACDAPANDRKAEDLPAASATPDGNAGSVTSTSSLSEDSPGGEGVTAEEIPHSNVPPPSRAVFTDAACDFEDMVGKPVDEAALKKIGRPYRILKPDSMMTMDHSPERINVVHDKDMKVTRVWCG
jgi:hypothetical protein